jgi:hypothetical protein
MNFIEKKEQTCFSRKSSTRRTKEAIWKKVHFDANNGEALFFFPLHLVFFLSVT